ncbi:hypothetical protein [Candidatus Coxiella mudrowiae]|uniref:hypothetical protein n=1 Tax=Candidatus Coxiella mudrowiae TaxID=2054173 RepID=UPI000C294641|nr:hypothetical protein [Candidatus Coxiella mudrowiae]
MALDVSTLKKVYGANRVINSGDTIHRFPHAGMNLFTLWDPASNDTLDCTDYAGDVRLFVEGSDQLSDVGDNFSIYSRHFNQKYYNGTRKQSNIRR